MLLCVGGVSDAESRFFRHVRRRRRLPQEHLASKIHGSWPLE